MVAYANAAKEITKKHGERVVNHTGIPYNYKADELTRVDRFLTIGTSGGSYYASESNLTKENAAHFIEMLDKHGTLIVNKIIDVSTSGIAAKQQPAIFALALASAHDNVEVRRAALAAVNQVCRTASTLFQFLEYVTTLRGWGRSLKRAVQMWYSDKTVEQLAYQMVKYRTRNGWSHKDALHLSHTTSKESAREELYNYAYTGESDMLEDYSSLDIVRAFDILQNTGEIEQVLSTLKENRNIPFEAIPNEHLSDKRVWEQLVLNGMPMTALIRNLSKITSVGALENTQVLERVLSDLENQSRIEKARIHPINVLSGLVAYTTGESRNVNWTPNRNIVDALDGVFYMAFKNVEPTNKRMLLAVDCSGSMSGALATGFRNLTAAQVSAAMALVTTSVERHAEVVLFDSKVTPVTLSARERLDSVMDKMEFRGGATDCAAPYAWAYKNDKSYDATVMYTDYESNFQASYYDPDYIYHAIQAQRARGPQDMRVVNVAMTANNLSFSRKTDKNMLDVSGFSSDTPQAISLFVAGKI